ncbi:conserved hypothetical protein [Cupriavidus taiwanensis]|nr:conserved hypothetical protein [Cupriavidus taiwanensis]
MICAPQLEFSSLSRYTGKSWQQTGRGNTVESCALARRRTVPRYGAPGHHGGRRKRTGAPARRESALA